MTDRRRGPRRWDDDRGAGLLSFLFGVAYGIIVTVTVYTWIVPAVARL